MFHERGDDSVYFSLGLLHMTAIRFALVLLTLVVASSFASEKHIVSDKETDEFIQLALDGFWGKALDETDRPIQPKDEEDRKIVPIPMADARRVAQAGVPAGIAAWADLDWESYYKAFMKKERSSRRWSGKQIAYIGLLFGVAQGSTEKSLANTPRDKEKLDRAADMLAEAEGFIAATTVAAGGWRSPDKFYSITPPAGWTYSESEGDAGSSYAFTSPDGGAEVRISAMYHLSFPEELPDDVLELAFPNERGVTPITKVRGKGWDGLRRECTNTDQTTRWLGVTARRGSAAVLLTMKAPSDEFERYRATFESVRESLQLGE
jgi:hypothetical protein